VETQPATALKASAELSAMGEPVPRIRAPFRLAFRRLPWMEATRASGDDDLVSIIWEPADD
jgi:hypothetical protein